MIIKLTHSIAFLIYFREDYERSMEYVVNHTDWQPKFFGFKTKNLVAGIVRG